MSLADLVAVASLHWPQSSCRGREHVRMVNVATIDRVSGERGDWGYAIGRACTVLVAPKRQPHASPRYLCRLLVHEFGHLAGRGHSQNPHSVMSHVLRDERTGSPECWRL